MKRFFVLIFCLLLALSILGCGQQSNPVGDVKTSDTETPAAANLTALTYCNGTITSRFVLGEEDTWQWVDEPEFPLDAAAMQEVLDAVVQLQELPPLSDVEALSAYALEAPARYMAASYSDGSTNVFYFGKKDDQGNWYVRTTDGQNVYLAPKAVGDLLDRNVYDMTLLPTLPELTVENIKSITINDAEKGIVLTVKDGAWRKGISPAGEAAVDAAEAIMAMQLKKCVDYMPSESAWSVCGLTEPAGQVQIVYSNTVGTEAEETLRIGNYRESENGYFAALNEDNAIYLLDVQTVETILAANK